MVPEIGWAFAVLLGAAFACSWLAYRDCLEELETTIDRALKAEAYSEELFANLQKAQKNSSFLETEVERVTKQAEVLKKVLKSIDLGANPRTITFDPKDFTSRTIWTGEE